MYLAYRLRPLFRPTRRSRPASTATATPSTPIRTWLLVGRRGAARPLRRHVGRRPVARSTCCGATAADFGTEDPYFDRDIGFYVFDLPWLHYLVDSAMAFAVVALLMAALVHYLYGGIRLQTSHDRLSGAAQAQLSVLLGLFVLAKAADYWLDRFDLVHQSGRLITGMTYTDEHAVLPAKNILMGIAVICAVLFFLNVLAAHLAAAVGRAGAAGAVGGAARHDLAGHRPAVPGRPDRGRQGGAVHRGEHRRDPGGVRPRGRRGRAVHQRGSTDHGQLGVARRADLVGAAGRPAAGARRPSSRSSRCAPTTPSRRCSTSTATRSTARTARSCSASASSTRPASRGRPQLDQPAHRLHPRQRRDRRVRQPAPRGQRRRSAATCSGPRASRPTRTP